MVCDLVTSGGRGLVYSVAGLMADHLWAEVTLRSHWSSVGYLVVDSVSMNPQRMLVVWALEM